MPDADLVRTLKAHGLAVVVVLVCGRPLVIPLEVMESIDALLSAWLPGTEGGGVADVLFGRCRASGKLSFSWPCDMQQMRLEERRKNPRFPFGFGLRT